MSPFQQKINVLNQIYAVYDRFTASLDMACKKYCADCCTCNVSLTTLEAYPIAAHLMEKGGTHLLDRLASRSGLKRFAPKITTNQLALMCLQEKAIPEEESDPSWGRCPFLEQEACLIYGCRPFGCRCLLSSRKCGTAGCAEIPPFVLTVNTVFMQVIEHADRQGLTGNLIDLTLWMTVATHRREYEAGNGFKEGQGFIANRSMPCLMVPEAHREALKDILTALNRIRPGRE